MIRIISVLVALLSIACSNTIATPVENKKQTDNKSSWILLTEDLVDLGTTPILGQSVKLPLDIPGDLFVKYTNVYADDLTITARPAPGIPDQPSGITYCYTGIPVSLKLGGRCFFWVAPLLEVSWYQEHKNAHIILSIKVYAASKK